MGDDDRNGARTIAGLAILLLVGGAAGLMYFMGANQSAPAPEPQAVVEPAAALEPEPEVYLEPAPEILPAPDIPASADIEPDRAPVICDFPGDGFVQYPHGFVPTDQYVAFDPPQYLSGYNGGPLPLSKQEDAPTDDEACAMVLYDISVDGRPINVSVLDVKPEGNNEEYYAALALQEVRTRRYAPGRRNEKPVRIDNNFLEVRFVADAR